MYKEIKCKNQTDFMDYVKTRSEIVIYGAGWAGKLVYNFLKIYDIQVSAFAVTKLQKVERIEQICVLSLDEALCKYPAAFIILAVLPDKQIEMQNFLEMKGVIDYFVLPELLLYEMRSEVLKYDADHWRYDIEITENKFRIGYLCPGYLDTNYAEQRLVINKVNEVEYISLPKVPGKVLYKDVEYQNSGISDCKMMTEASYFPGFIPTGIDLIHTFNTVCITDRLWIASFETTLPRIPITSDTEKAQYLYLVDYIVKDNCRGILALCRTTYNIQCDVLRQHLPSDIAEKIIRKTKILHPPQEMLISGEQFDKKHSKKQIQFIFIGHSFFFKGGREIINALSVFEHQYDFRLTVISSLVIDDYFTHASINDKLEIQNVIKTKKWIDYYDSLPNERVLEMCRQATVGLLPSFADTYGYAVLEMQAAGCPVITTNVRAFTETNDDECGWICTLPVNQYGMCDAGHLPELSRQLEKELIKCFAEIFQNPVCIKEKGRKALEKIKRMHDPKAYADVIRGMI